MRKNKPEKNKNSIPNKTKRKGKKALDDCMQDVDESTSTNLEPESKPVKIKIKKGKSTNRISAKLFKEEEFDDVDNAGPSEKNNETRISGDSVIPPTKKTKKKGKSLKISLFDTKSTGDVQSKKQHALKNQSAVLPKKKKKEIQIEETISNDDIKPQSENLPKNKKNKKKKGKVRVEKGSNGEPDSTEIEKLKFQKTKPNAVKYLLINLIRSILKKKISLSKSKLKKKVLKKFCKTMEVEEKPEYNKEYEKSLMLTYGVEILEDTVRLK